MKLNHRAAILLALISTANAMANWSGEKVELTIPAFPHPVTISVMKKIYDNKDKKSLVVLIEDDYIQQQDEDLLNSKIRPLGSKTCPHSFTQWKHGKHYYQLHFDFKPTIEFLSNTISCQNIAAMLSLPTITVQSRIPLHYWTPYSPTFTKLQEYCLIVACTSDENVSYIDQWFDIQKANLKKAMRDGDIYQKTTYIDGQITDCVTKTGNAYSNAYYRLTHWIKHNPVTATLAGFATLAASYYLYNYVTKN